MLRRSLALLSAVVLASPVRAGLFIVKTTFETTDTSCSTWKQRDWVGAQDICQPFGDAARYGMTSPTDKVYVKWTCTDTYVQKTWYSDSGCSSPIDLPNPYKRPLACSKAEPGQGTFRFYMETFACSQSYPAATWSRYTDSTCQTKDDTQPQEIIPLNFCAWPMWEGKSHMRDNTGRKITCASSGLETTLWQNRDCTGSSQAKSDAVVGANCMESMYYHAHVKVESGCDAGSNREISETSTSKAMTPLPFLLVAFLASTL